MGVREQPDYFQATFQSQLREPGSLIQNITGERYSTLMFEMVKSHQFLEITKKIIPPRIYWFARHGKQPIPGKISAKATLVSGDTVCKL